MATFLTSEESMANQVEVLVGGLCPQADDPDFCTANLPGFWAQIAAILWPGYFDPAVRFASSYVRSLTLAVHRRSGCATPSATSQPRAP